MAYPKTPCYKCERRSVNCHTNCEEYIDFRVDMDEYNEMVKNAKDKERMMRDYDIKHCGMRKWR